MFAGLKYQTSSVKGRRLRLWGELHWNWFAVSGMRNGSSHPNATSSLQLSSHQVGSAEGVGTWHRDDKNAVFYPRWLERCFALASFGQRPQKRTPNCTQFVWNQAWPDQRRHTLLWVTTATLNCLSSRPTGMAPLPSKLGSTDWLSLYIGPFFH